MASLAAVRALCKLVEIDVFSSVQSLWNLYTRTQIHLLGNVALVEGQAGIVNCATDLSLCSKDWNLYNVFQSNLSIEIWSFALHLLNFNDHFSKTRTPLPRCSWSNNLSSTKSWLVKWLFQSERSNFAIDMIEINYTPFLKTSLFIPCQLEVLSH